MSCCNCHRPFEEHCTVHVIPCCPGKCAGPKIRPLSPFRRISNDSEPLSQIARDEKRRAKLLALSILFLLIAAACIYLAQ